MNDQDDSRGPAESDEQRKARHWTWINSQGAAIGGHAREFYEKHGRGYWRATYGDDAAAHYIPVAQASSLITPELEATAGPDVADFAAMIDSYDPASQFVIAIKDPPGPVGVYKASILRVTPAGEG